MHKAHVHVQYNAHKMQPMRAIFISNSLYSNDKKKHFLDEGGSANKTRCTFSSTDFYIVRGAIYNYYQCGTI